jgi:formylglycine-generating enzyme required for sulfatase activity
VLQLQYSSGAPTLTIKGEVGAVYLIQYANDLSLATVWTDGTLLQAVAKNSWIDPSPPSSSQRFYRAVSVPNPGNNDLVFIQHGTFTMGSPTSEVGRSADEGPQTTVTISRGFWMGRRLVTQGEYLSIVGNNPSNFLGVTNRPVEMLSWSDATNFCAMLTTQDVGALRIPTNCVYRLPTEAEWEYTCRALTSTRFSYGDDPGYANLANYAWYKTNSASSTHPVGLKLPNPWGLYDTYGNVWEKIGMGRILVVR